VRSIGQKTEFLVKTRTVWGGGPRLRNPVAGGGTTFRAVNMQPKNVLRCGTTFWALGGGGGEGGGGRVEEGGGGGEGRGREGREWEGRGEGRGGREGGREGREGRREGGKGGGSNEGKARRKRKVTCIPSELRPPVGSPLPAQGLDQVSKNRDRRDRRPGQMGSHGQACGSASRSNLCRSSGVGDTSRTSGG